MENLPKERELSNIPSAHGQWFYPSPHQFYRASVAKGHEVDPKDMELVVAIHNAVNERAWFEIQRYEKAFHPECTTTKLIRFVGRPGDYSPKAQMLSALGREEPFDRHDWFIDRCGESVRYVVDFYDGAPSERAAVSMYLDTRPAVDNFQAVVDRAKMWWYEFSGQRLPNNAGQQQGEQKK